MFSDLDIIKYFRDIFIGIGIPDNNVHIYDVDTRAKDKQNTPSILISRERETVDIEEVGQWDTFFKPKLLRKFRRLLTLNIKITAHIDENSESDWHIGKITSLFFREKGLNRWDFDCGNNNIIDNHDDQLRRIVIKNIDTQYNDISNKNRGLIEAIIKITVFYFEYSNKV